MKEKISEQKIQDGFPLFKNKVSLVKPHQLLLYYIHLFAIISVKQILQKIGNQTMSFKFVVLFFSLFMTNSLLAKEYPVLRVCSESGFIPFEMRTSSGDWTGYDIDLARKFAANSSRKIELIDMKFENQIPSLLSKKSCDMIASAVGIDAEREKIVLFSSATYESAYAGITRTEDLEKYNNFENINQKNVRIAVEQGTEACQYVQSKFIKAQIISYNNNIDPINAVMTNKVDIYIDDSVFLSVAVKRKAGKLILIKPNIFPLFRPEVFPENDYSGMGFVFRKSDHNLCAEFNKFFSQLKDNGALAQMQKYYFDDMTWLKDFP